MKSKFQITITGSGTFSEIKTSLVSFLSVISEDQANYTTEALSLVLTERNKLDSYYDDILTIQIEPLRD